MLKNTCGLDLDNADLSKVILVHVDVPKAVEILESAPEYEHMIKELQISDALYRMLKAALQLRYTREHKVRK